MAATRVVPARPLGQKARQPLGFSFTNERVGFRLPEWNFERQPDERRQKECASVLRPDAGTEQDGRGDNPDPKPAIDLTYGNDRFGRCNPHEEPEESDQPHEGGGALDEVI